MTAFPGMTRWSVLISSPRNRRRGDRSLREEDRYLFLEAILSARDALHISYVGQSAVDNSELPPSVVISDLQDVIEQGFDLPQGIGSIVMRHPLQAYSPSYFSRDSRWFSYSKENFEGLAARRVLTLEGKCVCF